MGRPKTLPQSLPSLGRIFRLLAPRLRARRGAVAASVLALVAGVALKLLEPWPLKFVFDRILVPGGAGESGEVLPLLLLAAAAVVLVTVLRAGAEYASAVGFARIGNRVLTELRDDLYRHLQRLSLSYHHAARGGDLTVRVVGDVNMLKDLAATALLPLAASVLVLVGMAGLMLWLDWRLGLLILGTLPLFWLATGRRVRRIRDAARKQRSREGEMASTAAESLGAIKVVQALSLEAVFARVFSARSDESRHESVKTARLAAGLERRVDVLAAVATAAVLGYGAHLVLRGQLTPGDLIVFLAYLKRSFNPLQDFAKYTGRIAKAAAAGERVLDVMGRTPEVRDLPGAVPAPAFRGDVHFDRVTFGYGPDRPVLDGLDLAVAAGTRVAVVGPSGAGKSTLLSLLLRLYDPDTGRVRIDGRDVRAFTVDSLRGRVSAVLQDSLLFAASVRDNIGYGAPDVGDAEVEAAARAANAHAFIARLPAGYDTVLGERGVTLSHGQRQRLAVARASVRNAPILVLDEPTTGLDEANERAVTEALWRLAAGRTTFLVTHDLEAAARADRVVYLDGGRVVEDGTHAELMRAGGRYAALYRLQSAERLSASPEVPDAVPG